MYPKATDEKKRVGFITLGLILGTFLMGSIIRFTIPPDLMKSKGIFPLSGTNFAQLEVILIEDLVCENFRIFFQKTDFSAFSKVPCAIVPVSFLAGSEVVANASLGGYHRIREQFFPFLNRIDEPLNFKVRCRLVEHNFCKSYTKLE